MTDLASVGYSVDTSGLERGAAAVDKFGRSVQSGIVEPTRAIEAAAKRAGVSVDEMRARIAAAGANVAAFERNMAGPTTATQRFALATGQATAAATQAATATGRYAQMLTGTGQAYVGVTQAAGRYVVAVNAGAAATRSYFERISAGQAVQSLFAQRATEAAKALGGGGGGTGPGLSDAVVGSTAAMEVFSRVIRRIVFVALVREARQAVVAIWNLNAELSKTGDIANRINFSASRLQGFQAAAGMKGIDATAFLDSMLKFNDQVSLARQGLGDLGTLFRANGLSIKDNEDALQKVSTLVRAAAGDTERQFSILAQAGLPRTREWIRLLEQGPVALSKQAGEATKFSAEQLKRAQELDDKFNELWINFVRGAKSAVLAASEFPKAGTPLANFIDMATGKKEWSIKFNLELGVKPGSLAAVIVEKMGWGGGAASAAGPTTSLPASPVGGVERGADLANIGGLPVDIEKEKQKLALLQRGLSLMGEIATVGQKMAAKQREMNIAMLENATITPKQAEAAMKVARAQEDGTFALQAQIDAQRVETETIGMTVAKAETYRIVQGKINENLRLGKEAYADITAEFEKLADRLGKAKASGELELELNRARFDATTALLGPLAKEIALLEKKYGKTPQVDEIANEKRKEAALVDVKNAAEDMTKTLAQGLMDGKSGVDILINVLDQLKAALLNSGIKDLFSGDPLTMAIGAVKIAAAFAIDMFSDDMKAAKELQKAKDAFAEMSGEVRAFNNAADGFELSQFVSAMQQITKTGLALIKAAMAAGDTATAVQLIFAGVKQINNTVDQFIKPKGNTVAEQIANVNNEAQQIIGELDAMNKQYGLGLNRTVDILAGAAAHVADIQKKAQEEIERRRAGFSDRLLNATADSNTLDGALALLDRQHQREREDEVKAGGEALIDLEAVQARERYNVVRDYNDRIAEDARKTAQEQLEAQTQAARTILEYISGVNTGAASALSPAARLAEAQIAYDAKLGLAQANNADALSSITADAEVLRSALRDMFGSTSSYQQGWADIQSQLVGLPAVQTSEDPLIVALRANAEATLGNTTATDTLSGTTVAVNTGFTDMNTKIGSLAEEIVDLATDIIATAKEVVDLATDVGTSAGKIVTLGTDVGTSAGKIVTLGTDVGTSAGKIITLGTDVGTSAGKIVTLGTDVGTSAGKIVTLGTDVGTSSGKIVTLGTDVGTSAGNIVTLGERITDPTTGAAVRLLALANTIGPGGDQQLKQRMIDLATEVNTSAGKIVTLGTEVGTSAGKIVTLGTDVGTSAGKIVTFGTDVGTSAGKIVTLGTDVGTSAGKIITLGTDVGTSAGKIVTFGTDVGTSAGKIVTLGTDVGTSAGKIVSLGTDVGTTAGKVVTMGNEIGSSTSGIGTVVGNTAATAANIGVDHTHGLHGTMNLIKDNLTIMGGTATTSGHSGFFNNAYITLSSQGQVGTDNNLLTALNKIVLNTGATAVNTYGLAAKEQVEAFRGVFAAGGWITGGIAGKDSVPIMAMPDEYMLRASATRALVSRFGRGALDMLNAGQLPIEIPTAPGASAIGYGGWSDEVMRRMADRLDDLEESMERIERAVVAGSTDIVKAVDGVKKAQQDTLREITTPRSF